MIDFKVGDSVVLNKWATTLYSPIDPLPIGHVISATDPDNLVVVSWNNGVHCTYYDHELCKISK